MNSNVIIANREIVNGKPDWSPVTRSAFKQMFNVDPGAYQITIKRLKQYRGTRYKYHFGHVLLVMVTYFHQNNINPVIDLLSGEEMPIDIDQLHDYHKQIFNPCLSKNILKRPNSSGKVPEFIPIAMSTTKLSDSEFIDRYEEEIMATYANEYGIEFMGREEFAERCKDGYSCQQIVNELFNQN